MKKLLITGITGLIGRSVLESMLLHQSDFNITAIIRPDTAQSRYQPYKNQIRLIYIDLSDTAKIKSWLESEVFDIIVHIGALRGGRKFSRSVYYATNVLCTQQLVENALKNSSRFLFCSSVGVFGAIPDEMPASNSTTRKNDNYYHFTKNEAEKVINRAVLYGLKANILRPSITYGIGDYGFPWTLINLVSHRRFLLVKKPVWIHLCHIETITAAFLYLIEHDISDSSPMIIADAEPVRLKDLVNFISRQISDLNYPKYLTVDQSFFRIMESIFRFMNSELWTSRIELISRSWFYEVQSTYNKIPLPVHYTIPDIDLVIKEYKKQKRK